jgi:hypothetical protein
MSHALHSSRRHDLPAGWVGFVEILILAPLAAFLVLGVIPAAFGIEWECASGYGIVHTAGDSYLTSFAVAGTAGWLAVAAWVIFSLISERRRAAMLVAPAWFALLVLSSVVAAAAIGPAACPA